jgi:CBS domain-containing protein
MRENRLSCLPVVDGGKLVGLVTEHDLIVVASRLLEAVLEGE